MAVNITARDRERNSASGELHTDTFNQLANGVIFQTELCLCLTRDSLTNFRAQKARKSLRREEGAEEIRRLFKKTEE